jgi:hypothetical protein
LETECGNKAASPKSLLSPLFSVYIISFSVSEMKYIFEIKYKHIKNTDDSGDFCDFSIGYRKNRHGFSVPVQNLGVFSSYLEFIMRLSQNFK